MEDGEYLQEGFDPSQLRVQDLRNVFLRHDVEFPSNARKAEYVQLFNDQIVPKRTQLRKELHNVVPDSRGIVDAEPPKRRARSTSPVKSPSKVTKKSPRKKKELKEDDNLTKAVLTDAKIELEPPSVDNAATAAAAASPSPRRKGRKTLSKNHIVEPDAKLKEEFKATPSVIKVDPSKKAEKKAAKKDDADSSPFSNKNVFQAASPPRTLTKKKRPHPFDADIEEEEKKLVPQKKRASKKSPVKKDQQEAEQDVEAPSNVDNTTSGETHTPGSIMRHFTSFPSSPEDELKTPSKQKRHTTIPATVSQPVQAQDPTSFYSSKNHTYSERKPKRLSFMPNLNELKMSSEFSEQLKSLSSKKTDPSSSSSSSSSSAAAAPRVASPPPQQQPVQPPQEELSPEDYVHFDADENDMVDVSSPEQPIDSQEILDTLQRQEKESLKELQNELDKAETKIAKAHKKTTKNKKKPARTEHHETGNYKFWLETVAVLFTVGFALTFFSWWRQERINVGYCNVGFVSDYKYGHTQDSTVLSKALDHVRPGCVPCPQHATCYPHFRADCEEDFIKRQSPFSLYGLFPVAPKCIADTEKQRRIYILTEMTMQILRQRNADAVCGETTEPASIHEDVLKSQLVARKAPSISDEEFDDLWRHAIRDIKQRDEIIVDNVRQSVQGYARPGDSEPNYQVQKTVLQSTSLARISLKCRAKRAITGSLVRHRATISGIAAAIILAIVGRMYIKQRIATNERVDQLVKLSYERLIEKQRLSDADEKGLTLRYIPSYNLRDDFLSKEPESVRMKLWKSVEKVVERNTNVRSGPRELHGEVMRAWEWIGSSDPKTTLDE